MLTLSSHQCRHGLLFFVLEQRIKSIGVGTELTKMLSGSALSQFVLTTALLAADDAEPLQVAHNGGIVLGQGLPRRTLKSKWLMAF
jgi:hypothetical protein